MGMRSRRKGKVGEREVAQLLQRHGFEARRGQQFAGGGDSPDVVHNIPNVHLEVKRVERFNLYEALARADADAGPGEDSVVFHRRNGQKWVVVMDADYWLQLAAKAMEVPDDEED